MTKAFDSIEQGLMEAIAHARGEGGANLHEVDISIPNVRAIRTRTGLTQAVFAKTIGVRKDTLVNWEENRRVPSGPAHVLLELIEKDPQIVLRTPHG